MKHFQTIYDYYRGDGISMDDAKSMTYIAIREHNKVYKEAVEGKLFGVKYKRNKMKVTAMGGHYTKLDKEEGTFKTIFSKMGIVLVALQVVTISFMGVAIYALGVGLSQ